jgi:hypothetical protein
MDGGGRGVLLLTRERDRLALIRLASAVRAAYDRSAMVYADTDLAIWVRRWMEEHHRRLIVEVPAGGGIRFADGDPAAWDALHRALGTGRFE